MLPFERFRIKSLMLDLGSIQGQTDVCSVRLRPCTHERVATRGAETMALEMEA